MLQSLPTNLPSPMSLPPTQASLSLCLQTQPHYSFDQWLAALTPLSCDSWGGPRGI